MNPLTYPLVEFFADVVRDAESGIPRLEPIAHGALPDFSSLTRPPRERSIASVFLGGDALKADIRRFLHLRRGRLPDDARWSVDPIWEVERKLSQVDGYRPGTFIGYLRISCDLREQVEEHRTWIEGRMIGQLRRRLASASGLLLSRSIALGNSVLEEMLERDDREEVRGFCDLIRLLGLRVGLPLLAQPRTLDRALLEFALAVLARTTAWNRSHPQTSRPVRPLDVFFGAQATLAFHQGLESCSLVEIRDRVLAPGAPLSGALDSWLRGLGIHVGDSLLPCRPSGAIAADDDPRNWIWTAVQDLVTSTEGEIPTSGRLAFLERSLREYAARFEAFKHAISDRIQSLVAGQLAVAARSASSAGASRAESLPRFETAVPFGPIEGLDPAAPPLPLRPLPASADIARAEPPPWGRPVPAPASAPSRTPSPSLPVAGTPAAPPPPAPAPPSSQGPTIIFASEDRSTTSASAGVPLSPILSDIPLSPLLADAIDRTPASAQESPGRETAPEIDPDHSGEWPALFSLSDLERQATYLEEAMRSGWTSHGRRWVEMLHRYLGDARFREFLGFEDAWAAGVRDNLIGGPPLLYAGLEDLIRFLYRGMRHIVDLDFRYNQRQGDVPQKRTGYDWIALRLCYLAFNEVLVRQDDPSFAPSALVVLQHWHSFSRLRGRPTHTPEWWAWLAEEVDARREAVAEQQPAPRGFRMLPAVEDAMRQHVAVPAPQVATLGGWAQMPLHALRMESSPELRRWASRLSMLSQLVEVAKDDALVELG